MLIAWALNINPFKTVNGYIELLLTSEILLRRPQSHGSEIPDQYYAGSQEIPTCSRQSHFYGPCRVLEATFLVYGPALFSFWLSYRQCLATHTSLSLVFRLCRRGKQSRNEAEAPAWHREYTESVITKNLSPQCSYLLLESLPGETCLATSGALTRSSVDQCLQKKALF